MTDTSKSIPASNAAISLLAAWARQFKSDQARRSVWHDPDACHVDPDGLSALRMGQAHAGG